MKRTGFKPRTTEMPRSAVGLSRSRIKPVSDEQKVKRAAITKACPLAACCLVCETPHGLTRSHILTVKQHPQHAANPLNVVTLCWPHHCVWENQKQEFKRNHPEAWNAKLAAMRRLNRSYYAFFCQKNGGPVPIPA